MSPEDFQKQLDDRATEDKQNAQVAEQINTLKDLASEIRTLLDSLSTTGAKKLDSNVVAAISTLGKVVNSIDAIKVTSDQDIKVGLQAISSQLANLNVQPIVKVPEPSVVVHDTPIDLSPVIAAIKTIVKPIPPHKIDLSSYRAQDLDEMEQGIQYVGFLNPDGEWYIIRNEEALNKVRYAFGKSGYHTVWTQASKLDYKLLNEAINEVQT